MGVSLSTDLIKLIISAEPTGFQATGNQVKALEKNLDKLKKQNEKLKKETVALTSAANQYRKLTGAPNLRANKKLKDSLAKVTGERRIARNEIKRNDKQIAKLNQGLKQENVTTRISAQRKKELVDGYIKTDVTARKLASTNKELNTLAHKAEPLSKKEISRVKTLATQQQFLTKQFKGQIPTTKTLNRDLKGLDQRYKQTGDSQNYYRQGYNTLFSAQQKGVKLTKKQTEQMAGFSHKLKQSGSAVTQFAKKMFIWAFGWTLAYAGIRLITQGFFSLFKQARETETAMARVNAVLSITEKHERTFGALEKAVFSYGKTSSKSFKDIGEAMYYLATVGLNAQEVLAGFHHEMDLITATQSDTATTSRLVAGSYKLFGNQIKGTHFLAQKFAKIVDVLTYAYSQHQVELNEIAEAYQYVGGTAGLLDISFEELVGTIGFLNTRMLRGSRAGTTLFNTMIRLAEKSDNLKKIFHVTLDPSLPIDFRNVMEQLHKVTEDNINSGETLGKLYQTFGRRAARGVALILGDFEAWEKAVDELTGNLSGTARKLRDIQEKTFGRQAGIIMKKMFTDTIGKILETQHALAETLSSTKAWQERLDLIRETMTQIGAKSVSLKDIYVNMWTAQVKGGKILRQQLILSTVIGTLEEERLRFIENIAKARRENVALTKEQSKILSSMPLKLRTLVAGGNDIFEGLVGQTEALKLALDLLTKEKFKTKDLKAYEEIRSFYALKVLNIMKDRGDITIEERKELKKSLVILLNILDVNKYRAQQESFVTQEIQEAIRVRRWELDLMKNSALTETKLEESERKRLFLIKEFKYELSKSIEINDKDRQKAEKALDIYMDISGKITDKERESAVLILQKYLVEKDIADVMNLILGIEKARLDLEGQMVEKAIAQKYNIEQIINRDDIRTKLNIKLNELAERHNTTIKLIGGEEIKLLSDKEYELEKQKAINESIIEYHTKLKEAREEIQGPIKEGLKDILSLEDNWSEITSEIDEKNKKLIEKTGKGMSIMEQERMANLLKYENKWKEFGETVSNVFGKIGDAWQEKVMDRMFSNLDELMDTKLPALTQNLQETWATGGGGANIPTGAITATVAAGIIPLAMQGKLNPGDKKIIDVSIKNNESVKSELNNQTSKLGETSLLAASYIINALWASTAETIKYNEDGTQDVIKNEAKTGAEIGSLLGTLTGFIPGIGPAVSAAWMVAGSFLGGLIGSGIKTIEEIGDANKDSNDEITERLEWIVGEYSDTNKELKIANRNLVAIRDGFEGWIMPESTYFRGLPRFQGGGIVPGLPSQEVPAILHGQETVSPAGTRPEVTIGSMTVNINDVKQAEDIIRVLEQSWTIKTKRAYQGV